MGELLSSFEASSFEASTTLMPHQLLLLLFLLHHLLWPASEREAPNWDGRWFPLLARGQKKNQLLLSPAKEERRKNAGKVREKIFRPAIFPNLDLLFYSLSLFSTLSLLHAKRTTKNTPLPSLCCSLNTLRCKKENTKEEDKEKKISPSLRSSLWRPGFPRAAAL